MCFDDGGWQGGHAFGNNLVHGVAALQDGSVVLGGVTDGDIVETGSHVGGLDFAVVKLTADGEFEWAWQVMKQDDLGSSLPPPNPSFTPCNGDYEGDVDEDDDGDDENTA